MRYTLLLSIFFIFCSVSLHGQEEESVAREWNEILLESIRNDFARPTVHARNLFHISAAMYDAWAVYDEVSQPYLLGREVHGFKCGFNGVEIPQKLEEARNEAISYAAFRLITHRFKKSPVPIYQRLIASALMRRLGYDTTFTSIDYTRGNPAALGNYIAKKYIEYGLQDGSNEANEYANTFYEPVNQAFNPDQESWILLNDPNRWQPLSFENFIGQSGFSSGSTPEFLSPEWGFVNPFSLQESDKKVFSKDGDTYWVYHDPGPPPLLTNSREWDDYRKGFMQVLEWSSQLDPADGIMWDISPGAFGNMEKLPETEEETAKFYDVEGGIPGEGHPLNPHTGLPYEPQIVPRGDFTRVVAEFWADGPDSETPPGHWFTILNYVNDNPLLERKLKGEGPEMDRLEWDVKSYFLLGTAMHDAAISAWSIKGYYDYIRPVSAIRYLGQFQQYNPQIDNYKENGLNTIPGFLAVIKDGDSSLVDWNNIRQGDWVFYTGSWKAWGWRGFDLRSGGVAGVGWLPIRTWMPYQRISFVTPPFAGYVSGHSTFSRAAAEVLTMMTGDKYFPGGMGEFDIPRRQFLVFEIGPSVPLKLQWATYRDAADQSALSRIWGGIHPPADDIPGRIIGEKVGKRAFEVGIQYLEGKREEIQIEPNRLFFPNPVQQGNFVQVYAPKEDEISLIQFVDISGKVVEEFKPANADENRLLNISTAGLGRGIYFVKIIGKTVVSEKILVE
ncbi:MAG: T9SS type A sorting domain-containing protein [Bacteroidia bacterium]|nr:T9SS type A sorting domain-containing protein [Bacteroidia bacterium]